MADIDALGALRLRTLQGLADALRAQAYAASNGGRFADAAFLIESEACVRETIGRLKVLDEIHEELDGTEWESATCQSIADRLREIGYTVRDLESEDESNLPPVCGACLDEIRGEPVVHASKTNGERWCAACAQKVGAS